LVRFGIPAIPLQVQPFNDTLFAEYVVTSSCSFHEPHPDQQTAQIVKPNVGIRLTVKDTPLQSFVATIVPTQLSTSAPETAPLQGRFAWIPAAGSNRWTVF
jgi:hypothetical protein